jgi:hypothetical protein
MTTAKTPRLGLGAAAIGYSTLAALVLTSDAVSLGGPLTDPLYLWPFAIAFASIHLMLGFVVGRWFALGLCALPVVEAVVLAPWVPKDSDVPAWPSVLPGVLAVVVMPMAGTLVAAGIALRRRSDRRV